MRILAIETSCDETAISIIEGGGSIKAPKFKVLAHLISSQVELHAQWGGVVPSLAKREHSRNLIPLLKQVLGESKLVKKINGPAKKTHLTIGAAGELEKILEREQDLLEQFLEFIPLIDPPKLDAIAVTRGPGLEPALWVGINLARALNLVWNIPIVPVNHLEGHLASVLIDTKTSIKFPLLGLIVSGGHTELVLAKDWLKYKLIGATRDDAAGEAFDKVARILGLPYPGGPAIGQLAIHGSLEPDYHLPRPMINSNDFDFSFSGLKTAVLYLVKKLGALSQIQRADIARQFQQAVIDTLITKTMTAITKYKPKTLVIGGGVIANEELRRQFNLAITKLHPETTLLIPELKLTTDNATMIAVAAYLRLKQNKKLTGKLSELTAAGNLSLS
jgi:N6-L-threonylcarbamoyladenine synthase